MNPEDKQNNIDNNNNFFNNRENIDNSYNHSDCSAIFHRNDIFSGQTTEHVLSSLLRKQEERQKYLELLEHVLHFAAPSHRSTAIIQQKRPQISSTTSTDKEAQHTTNINRVKKIEEESNTLLLNAPTTPFIQASCVNNSTPLAIPVIDNNSPLSPSRVSFSTAIHEQDNQTDLQDEFGSKASDTNSLKPNQHKSQETLYQITLSMLRLLKNVQSDMNEDIMRLCSSTSKSKSCDSPFAPLESSSSLPSVISKTANCQLKQSSTLHQDLPSVQNARISSTINTITTSTESSLMSSDEKTLDDILSTSSHTTFIDEDADICHVEEETMMKYRDSLSMTSNFHSSFTENKQHEVLLNNEINTPSPQLSPPMYSSPTPLLPVTDELNASQEIPSTERNISQWMSDWEQKDTTASEKSIQELDLLIRRLICNQDNNDNDVAIVDGNSNGNGELMDTVYNQVSSSETPLKSEIGIQTVQQETKNSTACKYDEDQHSGNCLSEGENGSKLSIIDSSNHKTIDSSSGKGEGSTSNHDNENERSSPHEKSGNTLNSLVNSITSISTILRESDCNSGMNRSSHSEHLNCSVFQEIELQSNCISSVHIDNVDGGNDNNDDKLRSPFIANQTSLGENQVDPGNSLNISNCKISVTQPKCKICQDIPKYIRYRHFPLPPLKPFASYIEISKENITIKGLEGYESEEEEDQDDINHFGSISKYLTSSPSSPVSFLAGTLVSMDIFFSGLKTTFSQLMTMTWSWISFPLQKVLNAENWRVFFDRFIMMHECEPINDGDTKCIDDCDLLTSQCSHSNHGNTNNNNNNSHRRCYDNHANNNPCLSPRSKNCVPTTTFHSLLTFDYFFGEYSEEVHCVPSLFGLSSRKRRRNRC